MMEKNLAFMRSSMVFMNDTLPPVSKQTSAPRSAFLFYPPFTPPMEDVWPLGVRAGAGAKTHGWH